MSIKRTSRIVFVATWLSLVVGLPGCGPSTESTKTETPPPVTTADMLYRRGHQFYLQQYIDSAQTLLLQALAMDANSIPVLTDLAPLQYDRAMSAAAGKTKTDLFRKARDYYASLELLGTKDSDLYERLCEISKTLNDEKSFLKYAKKNADMYPYDRQYYNLSVAYFDVEDYNNVIKVCKEGIDKFKQSIFVGTFYRQLGRAYMKVDRDQTAEKNFYSGLAVIDARISAERKANPGYASSAEYAKLKDDKAGILVSLKYLHTTYKAAEKLADVERKLKELGR